MEFRSVLQCDWTLKPKVSQLSETNRKQKESVYVLLSVNYVEWTDSQRRQTAGSPAAAGEAGSCCLTRNFHSGWCNSSGNRQRSQLHNAAHLINATEFNGKFYIHFSKHCFQPLSGSPTEAATSAIAGSKVPQWNRGEKYKLSPRLT